MNRLDGVTLNLFQGPSSNGENERVAPWILKQIQDETVRNARKKLQTLAGSMLTPELLVKQVKNYNPKCDEALLAKACEFSARAHSKQKRASGEPYFQHPLEVAGIIADMRLDVSSVITALLHDTVEDTEVTLKDIQEEFGEEISRLVDGVTKLTKIEYQPEGVRQAENFRKLLLAMSEDIRVLLVKLGDRLHNMRTLHYVKSEEKRRRIAHETMEIYAPLAERMGMQQVKIELQDIAFAELHPDVRQSIIKRLEFLRNENDHIIERIVTDLTQTLEKEGLHAKIEGREKTPCSIWKKMENKNLGFDQLADIIAFRVVVDSVEDCYRALGIVHAAYKMVPDNFKDYISTPKNNGYQSLHTVVIGPEQHRIEVQIRTESMHDIAEYGVAAHWSYKQKTEYGQMEGKQFRWLRELLQILEHDAAPEEFLENTKLEMYYNQVFCFTPRGDLIALPKGATTVDFAYAVHSDVGSTCVGAKVNGRIVPLKTVLHNGDQVDIIRSKTQVPSPAWEKFVVTGKARSEIRKFIRQQQRDEYLNLGKAILTKAFKQEGHDLKDSMLEPLLEVYAKDTIDDVYVAIGEGTITRADVLTILFPDRKEAKDEKKSKSLLSIFRRKHKKRYEPDEENAIPIKGLVAGMAVHFAGCCHPLPGEKIVGIVNTGKGITIHTTDCDMLSNYSDMPERWIDVAWEKESHAGTHIGRLKVILSHETGSLATLSNTIAKDLGNICNLKITNRSSDFFEMIVDVEVKGVRHLANIIASLRAQAGIHSVERTKM
jgi:guanosine-3',5'-bis(diphosphate) 3'-pyrophosphohydrolase